MSERTNLITEEDINSILDDLNKKSIIEVSNEDAASAWPYIGAAAVLAYYDPNTIRPLTGKQDLAGDLDYNKNVLIGQSNLVVDSTTFQTLDNGQKKYSVLFTLKDDVRKTTLKRLSDEKKIAEAISVNNKIANLNIPLQYMLTHCLQKQSVKLSLLSFEELTALLQILFWLDHIPDLDLPLREHIVRQMELIEMMGPFRHLTGVYENNVFVEKFKGRKSELATLRSYVGVAQPKNLYEKIGRVIYSFLNNERRPLFIFGPGGVGKSALLSKFLLEHAEAHEASRFPFVYLDFDRPNLSALDTETLIIEASRQLAIQYIDIEGFEFGFSEFYDKWNQSYNTLTGSAGTSQINLESVKRSRDKHKKKMIMRSDFALLAKKLYDKDGKPFLIVLDTFEEVQFKGIEFVNEVLELLEELQVDIPSLRAVIAGRSPIDKEKTVELELGDLDPEAAQAFLIGSGISATDAKQIAGRFSGNPLSLKLAAEIVKKHGLDELFNVDIRKGYFNFSRSPEIEVQGMLYNRILKHLHSNNVKKIAHPGLVLRKITPELILRVLTDPCELDIKTLQEAKELFEELSREVSLVTKHGAEMLKHRPDVRKVMLRLIMQSDKLEQAMQIHRLAVSYYSQKDSISDRAEEFYHQLSIGVSPRELEARWIDGIEDHLAGNIDELPDKAQAYLLSKIGMNSVNKKLWDMADIEDKLRYATKQAAELLNAGLAERALRVLDNAAIGDSTDAAITTIKVRALRQLNKNDEAAKIASQALKSYYADDIPLTLKAELQKYASDAPQINLDWNILGRIENSDFDDQLNGGMLNKDVWSDNLKKNEDENNIDYDRKSEDNDMMDDDFTTFMT